jgi:ribosomal protein S18 acetylase RimI-like enzyme
MYWHVREYSPIDYERVMDINKSSHASPSPDWLLLEKLHELKSWVAEINGVVAGFLVATFKQGRPYIYNIAVDENYRDKGCASALIWTFDNHYKNRAKWLQVDADNPAQTLYYKLGYRIYDIGHDYYGKGKHALAMQKMPS